MFGDTVHTLKALCLFVLGCYFKDIILLGSDLSIFLDIIYYLVLIWITFKFETSYQSPSVPVTDFNVCIIGAGFSGIGMAIKLKQTGVKFRLLEKGSRFGGTWWDNQYPGCACDVPSHLYSYSYALNPDWSKSYSPQPEIFRYLDNVAKEYGIDEVAEFGKKVVKTTWNQKTNKWTIELDNGEIFTANVITSGNGPLHVPQIPDFQGKDTFKGDVFHSAEWKSDYDPKGKRIAVIGTGASAVQIVPSIAAKVKHLTVFQRTPCWVSPRMDFYHPAWLKLIFRIFPLAMYLYRSFLFWRLELLFYTVFRMEGRMRKAAMATVTEHVKKTVKDPEVAKKLTPSFEMGCKRITPSDTYLQSYNRKNVTLETEGIDSITENGIKTKDGVLHEVDTIIYATGFSLEKSARPYDCYGTNVTSEKSNGSMNGTVMNGHANTDQNSIMNLGEDWGDLPNAYKAITYPGYPNYFFILGPGSGLGHNSIIFMIECQITYIHSIITKMINTDIKSVDVKKQVNTEYQKWIQEWLKNKVFNSTSCVSWYKNARGINFTLWPSHLTHYWWVTRKADLENYNCKY